MWVQYHNIKWLKYHTRYYEGTTFCEMHHRNSNKHIFWSMISKYISISSQNLRTSLIMFVNMREYSVQKSTPLPVKVKLGETIFTIARTRRDIIYSPLKLSVIRSLGVFIVFSLNKLSNEQLGFRWFETPRGHSNAWSHYQFVYIIRETQLKRCQWWLQQCYFSLLFSSRYSPIV